MKNLKTRIAAAATILGLGGLTGLALSAGGQKASTLASKPLVKTKVIRRTVHVTKHVKPKHPVAGGPAGYAGAVSPGSAGAPPVVTGASSSGSAESAPVVTGSSSGGSAESAPVVTGSSGTGGGSAPVVTSASGGGGGGGEGEHDGGGGGGD